MIGQGGFQGLLVISQCSRELSSPNLGQAVMPQTATRDKPRHNGSTRRYPQNSFHPCPNGLTYKQVVVQLTTTDPFVSYARHN